MSVLIQPDDAKSKKGPRAPKGPDVITMLGLVGIIFAGIAGMDIVLTWIPTDFGNREWEFGTVTASLNGMISVTLGLTLILVWMRERGHPIPLMVMAGLFAAIGLAILLAAVLYWTNVPLALRAVQEGPIRTGLQKAMVKTSIQSAAYPVVYFYLAWVALRWRPVAASQSDESGGGPRS